jgi:hypothetical protein
MRKDEMLERERDQHPRGEHETTRSRTPGERTRAKEGMTNPLGEITPNDEDGLPDRPAKYRVPS